MQNMSKSYRLALVYRVPKNSMVIFFKMAEVMALTFAGYISHVQIDMHMKIGKDWFKT